MRDLAVPSLVSVAVPVAIMCWRTPELQGPVTAPHGSASAQRQPLLSETPSAVTDSSSLHGTGTSTELQLEVSNRDVLVLAVGLSALLFVPVFKHFTGLPPYLGMLSGLGVLWMVTDALHFGENKQYPRVQDALRNLDIGESVLHEACPWAHAFFISTELLLCMLCCLSNKLAPIQCLALCTGCGDCGLHVSSSLQILACVLCTGGVMFFLGILLSVEALNAAGLLQLLATDLNKALPDVNLVAAAIGVASAVIDNVRMRWGRRVHHHVSVCSMQAPCKDERTACTPPVRALSGFFCAYTVSCVLRRCRWWRRLWACTTSHRCPRMHSCGSS